MNAQSPILIVEDDEDIRGLLARGFHAEGFDVAEADRVDQALDVVRQQMPRGVIVDITLPDGSGFDICRRLRDGGYSGAIMFLSARDEVQDRAEGLSLGADDYIVKPFAFDELSARLQTHLLRREEMKIVPHVRKAGRLALDLDRSQAIFQDQSVRLSQREADLLAVLIDNVTKPLGRVQIFDKIWVGKDVGSSLNVVDVYIGYLRLKLQAFEKIVGPVIMTIRGKGFMLQL